MLLLSRMLSWQSALTGLAVTLSIIPLSVIVGRWQTRIRARIVQRTDARVKLTGEVLSGELAYYLPLCLCLCLCCTMTALACTSLSCCYLLPAMCIPSNTPGLICSGPRSQLCLPILGHLPAQLCLKVLQLVMTQSSISTISVGTVYPLMELGCGERTGTHAANLHAVRCLQAWGNSKAQILRCLQAVLHFPATLEPQNLDPEQL